MLAAALHHELFQFWVYHRLPSLGEEFSLLPMTWSPQQRTSSKGTAHSPAAAIQPAPASGLQWLKAAPKSCDVGRLEWLVRRSKEYAPEARFGLKMDNSFVEEVAASLVREFLSRKVTCLDFLQLVQMRMTHEKC